MPDALVCLLAHQPTGTYWVSKRYIVYLLSLYPSSLVNEEQRTLILENPELLVVFADTIDERLFRAHHQVNYLGPQSQIVTVNDRGQLWKLNMNDPVPTHIEGEVHWRESIHRMELVTC